MTLKNRRTLKTARYFLILITILLLSGCGLNKAINESYLGHENILYSHIRKQIRKSDFRKSAKILSKLEVFYPSSVNYPNYLILKAYSHYCTREYVDTILTTIDYLHQFPHSKHSDYMRYLKAMSYYNQIADAKRDQSVTMEAKKEFSMLLELFPESEYSRDARSKLRLIVEILAKKEMDIGKFYLSLNKPLSSIIRFKNVVDYYQDTPSAPEALYMLAEIYYKLDIREEAQRYIKLLDHKYSESSWCKKSHEIYSINNK